MTEKSLESIETVLTDPADIIISKTIDKLSVLFNYDFKEKYPSYRLYEKTIEFTLFLYEHGVDINNFKIVREMGGLNIHSGNPIISSPRDISIIKDILFTENIGYIIDIMESDISILKGFFSVFGININDFLIGNGDKISLDVNSLRLLIKSSPLNMKNKLRDLYALKK